MTDLKELIRALRRSAPDNHRCFGCGYENKCGVHGCRVMKEAADALEAALREQEEHRWIPVTERLPEPFERVIVCREDGKVEQGCKDVRDWWKVYGTRTKQVTHWMPWKWCVAGVANIRVGYKSLATEEVLIIASCGSVF